MPKTGACKTRWIRGRVSNDSETLLRASRNSSVRSVDGVAGFEFRGDIVPGQQIVVESDTSVPDSGSFYAVDSASMEPPSRAQKNLAVCNWCARFTTTSQCGGMTASLGSFEYIAERRWLSTQLWHSS